MSAEHRPLHRPPHRPLHRPVPARPTLLARSVAAVAVAAVPLLGLLAACGSPAPTRPSETVTVWVDPTPAPSPSGDGGAPSPVPTRSAVATSSGPGPVSVGPLRGAPGDYDEAARRVSDARVDGAVTSAFRSPSGNLACTVAGGGSQLACEVGQGRPKPPAAAPCPAGGPTTVGRVELTGDGARLVCNGDTEVSGTPPTLAYGRSARIPGTPFACVSEQAGVTCVDTARRDGLFLARNTLATW